MKSKQKTNVLLLLGCIFSYISVAVSILLAVFLAFNIAGASDFYIQLLKEVMESTVDLSGEVTMYIIELGFGALLNLYFASYYLKGLKYRIDSKPYAKVLITESIFQMIIGSFIAGLFSLIAGIRMKNAKVHATTQTQTEAYLSDYKMQAMSEAVRRLKELKAQGAISEEEYYASLNKILES